MLNVSGGFTLKKGRHRRFEEARALKRNQEMDIDSILESLTDDDKSEVEVEVEDEGHSPAFEAWASDFEDEENGPEEKNNT
ncbi:MAG: hypothetical protein CL432_03735 [Acidimicrobiaceae bacterium]|nr:hypothetical protein [Acidimicrobiaceae bacterium]